MYNRPGRRRQPKGASRGGEAERDAVGAPRGRERSRQTQSGRPEAEGLPLRAPTGNTGNRVGARNERQVYPTSYKEVEDLCKRIDSRELLAGSTDLIRKVTSLSFKKRLGEVWDQEQSTSNLLKLMISILNRKPTVVGDFAPRIAMLKMVCEKCEAGFDNDLKTAIATLMALFNNLHEQKKKMVTTEKAKPVNVKTETFNAEGPPPEDFREISVVPTTEDMLVIGKPYLRKNICHGRYNDAEHYLDVQFRLLREDFLDPLRSGVHEYNSARLDKKKRLDVYVYEDVHIGFPELDKPTGEMVCAVRFRRRRCRWIRQMIFGSLVVLSRDGFKRDFVFGTIHTRNVQELDKGNVKLLFEHLQRLDHHAKYKMIESSAYYEAYHHVLRGLQSFNLGEEIPFHRYLVEVMTTPRVPSYLVQNGYKIDFGVLFGDPEQETGVHRRKFADVRYAHEQLLPTDMNLDDSQHRALTMAFSQEMCVIQGPPGTGKTHLGHQISRVLLANQMLWNRDRKHPMLVVCYTNHALDQFLGGILKFMKVDASIKQQPMIRVGSRSKDEKVLEAHIVTALTVNCKHVILHNVIMKPKAEHLAKSVLSNFSNIVQFMKKLSDLLKDLESGHLPNPTDLQLKLMYPKIQQKMKFLIMQVDQAEAMLLSTDLACSRKLASSTTGLGGREDSNVAHISRYINSARFLQLSHSQKSESPQNYLKSINQDIQDQERTPRKRYRDLSVGRAKKSLFDDEKKKDSIKHQIHQLEEKVKLVIYQETKSQAAVRDGTNPPDTSTPPCLFCTIRHYSSSCPAHPTYQDRIKRAAEKGLCIKCHCPTHPGSCKINKPCKTCDSGEHRIALCDFVPITQKKIEELKEELKNLH